MPEPITGKLDVTKIKKEFLFKGAKGTYLDIALIPTPDSEYGEWMIVQSLPKENREAGEKGPILGNAKRIVRKAKEGDKPKEERSQIQESPEDSCPF